MEIFPVDILEIITTYAKDMTLLESQPTPFDISYYYTGGRNSPEKFVTQSLRDLLFTLVPRHELNRCIKQLLDIPAVFFLDFQTACAIYKKRCGLWDIKTDLQRIPNSWKYTLPYVLVYYLENGDIDQFHDDLFFCLDVETVMDLV